MCNHKKVYQVNLDFWIYGSELNKKQDVVNYLNNQIMHADNLPHSILRDIFRSLRKIAEMSEEIFEDNYETFKTSAKIKKEVEAYSDFVLLEKQDYWKHR
jgi:hypothetical protein